MVQVLESRSFDFNISGASMAFLLRSFFQFIVFKVIKVHVDKQLHFLVCDFLINVIKDRTVGASKGRHLTRLRLTEAMKPFFHTRMSLKSELCLIPALIDAVVDALTAHTLAATVMEPPLAFKM